jgi:hypothetical protein
MTLRRYSSENKNDEGKWLDWYESTTPEERREARKEATKNLSPELARRHRAAIARYLKRKTSIVESISARIEGRANARSGASLPDRVREMHQEYPEWSAGRIARLLSREFKVDWNNRQTNDNGSTERMRHTEAVKKILSRLKKRQK